MNNFIEVMVHSQKCYNENLFSVAREGVGSYQFVYKEN